MTHHNLSIWNVLETVLSHLKLNGIQILFILFV